MSTITPGSVCPSWIFAWTVQRPKQGSEIRSNPFSFKGHEVHLRWYVYKTHLQNSLSSAKLLLGFHSDSVELCTPPSFPSLSKADMIVRVQTKNKTPLDLHNQNGIQPNNKIFYVFTETQILSVYPDFRKDGGILTFLVYGVDPPKANTVKVSNTWSLERLSSDLSVLLWNQDSRPDLELLCGEGHSIKVHKNIVSARSKVISAMLRSDMSEARTGRIEIKDMNNEVFDHFVHYLYAGKLPDLNVYTARSLYEAGDQYEVSSLMRRCAIFLVENLTPENACELLVLADAHGDQDFKEYVMDYIVKNKIPLHEDHWLPFHGTYPKLSSEVLYLSYRWQNK